MKDVKTLERQLTGLPLYQYEILPTKELTFSEKVRLICQNECERYGNSWSCPPASGTVEECRKVCMQYPNCLVLVTAQDQEDHEALTTQAEKLVKEEGWQTLTLSAESCAVCEQCAYPGQPCRFPDRMRPCVEGFGILVTKLLQRLDVDVPAWCSLVLF